MVPSAHCPQKPDVEQTPAQQLRLMSVCSVPRATCWDLRCGAAEAGNLVLSDQSCPWQAEPSLVVGFPVFWMVPAVRPWNLAFPSLGWVVLQGTLSRVQQSWAEIHPSPGSDPVGLKLLSALVCRTGSSSACFKDGVR